MLLADGEESMKCCSGEVELVGTALDVVSLALVFLSRCARARVVPALLVAVKHVVCAVPPMLPVPGQTPAGREVGCSW
jgi:hypothetical protein